MISLPADDSRFVSRALSALMAQLVHTAWSSVKKRNSSLRRLALAQLDSTNLDDTVFARYVIKLTIQHFLPIALRTAAIAHPQIRQREALELVAQLCEAKPEQATVETAAHAAQAAEKAAQNAWAEVAGRAAQVAARAARLIEAACKETDGAVATHSTAEALTWIALAQTESKMNERAGDEIQADFAENVVRILFLMRAPGCIWLGQME